MNANQLFKRDLRRRGNDPRNMTFATLPDLSTIVPGAQVISLRRRRRPKSIRHHDEHGLYFLSWTTITRRRMAAGDSELKTALP
jgi:hypothetical protein